MSEESTKILMQNIASGLDDVLNGNASEKTYGFGVFIFPFNAPEGARTNWMSNANRKDMLVAMKEIVARFEGQAEVVGHG